MAELDAFFFKPFVDGTRHILKVSCQVEATPGRPIVKQRGARSETSFDIAAVISMMSSGFNGTITLCFPEKVYVALMSSMLGETYTTITDDLADGAAELLNMIYGHAKVVLNQQGHTIQKAIPTVIRGSNLTTSSIAGARVVVLPFLTPVGEFHLEISAE